MFVVGVAGQAQMGKDTLADRLAEKLNEVSVKWKRTAFAKNVKRVYAETFGVDYDFIEKWKVEDEPPPNFDMNVRKSLQFIGDGFRKIKEEIWVDLCFRDKSPQIISDVRYPNEFKRIAQEGGLNILVGRSDKLSNDPNSSESLIRPYVEYALSHWGSDPVEMVDLTEGYAINKSDPHYPPKDMAYFDLFVRNNGSKDDFLKCIDEKVVPFVQNFVFDFEIEKRKDYAIH